MNLGKPLQPGVTIPATRPVEQPVELPTPAPQPEKVDAPA